MLAKSSLDIPVKPRVLIADDSRIVRATLIKHIEGMFEFREALDGEQAWETLLIDPSIRVVITDLTMPKLDGYGLLQRIRNSKISRIRNLPVVVISGSDEQEERDRAKAAGATDLITKGIGTAQLLSRLDVLSKLVTTQHEFERGLEALVRAADADFSLNLASVATFQAQTEVMLENATRPGRNVVILNVCIGLKHTGLEGSVSAPPVGIVNAVGQMLQRTVRQTDVIAKTGDAEFTLASGSVQPDSARNFAQRVCRAIASASLVKDVRLSLVASCGMVSFAEFGAGSGVASQSVDGLREIAHQRALLGLNQCVTGVVSFEEEARFRQGMPLPPIAPGQESDAQRNAICGSVSPDLATMLQWVKEGKREQVLQHIGRLSVEMKPLLEFMLEQTRR